MHVFVYVSWWADETWEWNWENLDALWTKKCCRSVSSEFDFVCQLKGFKTTIQLYLLVLETDFVGLFIRIQAHVQVWVQVSLSDSEWFMFQYV